MPSERPGADAGGRRGGARRASPARSRSGRPAFSAIKVGGRRAYAMARAGETVELAEREVTIHALDLVEWDDSRPGAADRRSSTWRCSAGTYIRALARDLGETLGSAAYLGALVRTASGPFDAR